MAESPAFRTGYTSLLLPSGTGDLEVRSSLRNMVIDALAATGEWPRRVDVVTSTGSDDGQTKRWFVEYETRAERPGHRPARRAGLAVALGARHPAWVAGRLQQSRCERRRALLSAAKICD